MLSAGLNLVMTVIGFAVSIMFIVFVCTRLICARIQLRASRRSSQTDSRSDLSIIERGCHGLDPVLLSSFPTKKFGDHFPAGREIQCTVCLSEYQEKDLVRILPLCGHAFHVFCIDIWLKQHSTCPVCRISLRGAHNGKYVAGNGNNTPMRSPNSQQNPGSGLHFSWVAAAFRSSCS
ncbi:hypothetical protein HPP92_006426 [Vanilla planifolia]|uniref:RING-type domain-containing protein n=1 Tax=Vanilla planifolia TaxID=51239 RepID=A0A835VD78_VANPL|nr:hypothetical protein HPP92_006426 [Vanilla planifolia]